MKIQTLEKVIHVLKTLANVNNDLPPHIQTMAKQTLRKIDGLIKQHEPEL